MFDGYFFDEYDSQWIKVTERIKNVKQKMPKDKKRAAIYDQFIESTGKFKQ
ncbi:MAG: hypothetical protein Kow00108_11660 [Calditrichia bacterium]